MTAGLSATVDRAELLTALRWTAQALANRPPMIALNGVRLEAKGGELRLTCFDYYQSASAIVAAPGASEAALVPARQLAEMVSTLPKGAGLELRADAKALQVTGAGTTFRLPLLPLEDYPTVPRIEQGGTGTDFDGPGFARLAAVTVAAGRDDTLPVLTAVHLDTESGHLVAAATDRYRLAVQELGAGDLPDGWVDAMLPAKTLRSVGRAFAREPHVMLCLGTDTAGERLVTYHAGLRSLTCRLVEGLFPKYRSLLPTSFDTQVAVKRADLRTAITRAAVAAPRHAPATLALDAEAAVVTGGNTKHDDSAFASTSIEAKLTGQPVRIALNPAYTTDALAVLAGDDAHMSLNGTTKPVVFTSPDSPGLTYLLMPVRTYEDEL